MTREGGDAVHSEKPGRKILDGGVVAERTIILKWKSHAGVWAVGQFIWFRIWVLRNGSESSDWGVNFICSS